MIRYWKTAAIALLAIVIWAPAASARGLDPVALRDRAILEMAVLLRRSFRESDVIARFGGDEFVVMVTELSVDNPGSAAQADVIARKISAELARPYVFHVRHDGAAETTIEHCCTASIGAVLFGKDDASQDDILKWADTAMYRAKESGIGLIRYYDSRT